jgi:hypothetical protein
MESPVNKDNLKIRNLEMELENDEEEDEESM